MINIDNDALAESLISQYWTDFRSGATWNFYPSKIRNQEVDAWCNRSDWIENAMECVEYNTNLIQAFEILLTEKRDQYIDSAEKLVEAWHKSGAHDAHYYYDIIAKLPSENVYRRQYLSSDRYNEFVGEDEWGYASSARKALVNSNDQSFVEYLGLFINNAFDSDNVDIEYELLPLVIDLGSKSEMYIKKSNLEKLKEFCLDYLKKDEQVVSKFLNTNIDEDERQIWVGDDIAYYSWVLGWNDILEDLKNKDWYWMMIFSEWWEDSSNKNLLTWSLYSVDTVLLERAEYVMKQGGYNRLDGAIAWKRFKDKLTAN